MGCEYVYSAKKIAVLLSVLSALFCLFPYTYLCMMVYGFPVPLALRIIVAYLTHLVEFCFKGEKRERNFFFLHEKELRHREVHELISGHIIKLLITFELEPVS